MKEITLPAHAKINLTLDIIAKRPDGYHDLESVMQQVDLHDDVTVSLKEEPGITVRVDQADVPQGPDNIAHRAAKEILKSSRINPGVDIYITKRIPVAGGMAGGSTDAATVLKGLNILLGLEMDEPDLARIGVKIGADVPFCITGGSAIARGIGEQLTALPAPPKMWLVLVKPDFGVSTALVYKNFDFNAVMKKPDLAQILRGIENNNMENIYLGLGNVLESVTLKMYPVLAEIKEKLADWGAEAVLMSGSGPTIIAFTDSLDKAKALREIASQNLPATYQVVVTSTMA